MVFMHVSYRKTCPAVIDPKLVGPDAEMSLLYFTQLVFSSYLQYWQQLIRENDTEEEQERWITYSCLFFPDHLIHGLKHISWTQEDIMCDCPCINNGNIKKLWHYILLAHRDKTGTEKIERAWECVCEREKTGFTATHPNISRRCVTKYAGPIYVSEHQCIPLADRKCCSNSSVQRGSACRTHRGSYIIV